MCGTMTLRKQNSKEKPLAGAKIACCTHVTAQTAVSQSEMNVNCGYYDMLKYTSYFLLAVVVVVVVVLGQS